MAKFWSVNLTAHRQPLKCDNHDKHVLENCLMSYEKEKKKSIAVLATVTTMRKYVGQMQPRRFLAVAASLPALPLSSHHVASLWVWVSIPVFLPLCYKDM